MFLSFLSLHRDRIFFDFVRRSAATPCGEIRLEGEFIGLKEVSGGMALIIQAFGAYSAFSHIQRRGLIPSLTEEPATWGGSAMFLSVC